MEIRDTAIHFRHADLYLSKKVFEIGTASLKNYLTLITEWFNYDLSIYNFFLMPMTFFHEFEAIKSSSVNSNKKQYDYKKLNSELMRRYTDFKVNNNYHNIRKPLMKIRKYCKTRLLDPNNSEGQKKYLYGEEIFDEFDKNYTKKA